MNDICLSNLLLPINGYKRNTLKVIVNDKPLHFSLSGCLAAGLPYPNNGPERGNIVSSEGAVRVSDSRIRATFSKVSQRKRSRQLLSKGVLKWREKVESMHSLLMQRCQTVFTKVCMCAFPLWTAASWTAICCKIRKAPCALIWRATEFSLYEVYIDNGETGVSFPCSSDALILGHALGRGRRRRKRRFVSGP